MKTIRASLCILLTLFAAWLPVFGEDLDTENAEILRSGMTIACAGIGLAAGSAIGIGFSLDAIETPLSNMLLLTIPVVAAGAAAGALAGRWMTETFISGHDVWRSPNSSALTERAHSLLFSIVEGAGLGAAAGAFVGAITFTVNFALAYHILDVPEGYWGRFDYLPAIGMAVVSGSVWGGIFGAMAGAIALPIVSLIMNSQ
ncbi:hypothetical protein ACFLS0_01095 [Candidatus Bipolaricaulota bacterium]